jgi:hypothetical protein
MWSVLSKNINNKIPLAIELIFVGDDFIEDVEPQGLCGRCYKELQD